MRKKEKKKRIKILDSSHFIKLNYVNSNIGPFSLIEINSFQKSDILRRGCHIATGLRKEDIIWFQWDKDFPLQQGPTNTWPTAGDLPTPWKSATVTRNCIFWKTKALFEIIILTTATKKCIFFKLQRIFFKLRYQFLAMITFFGKRKSKRF